MLIDRVDENFSPLFAPAGKVVFSKSGLLQWSNSVHPL